MSVNRWLGKRYGIRKSGFNASGMRCRLPEKYKKFDMHPYLQQPLSEIFMANLISLIFASISYDQSCLDWLIKSWVPWSNIMDYRHWNVTWSIFRSADLGSIAFRAGIFCTDFHLQRLVWKGINIIIFKTDRQQTESTFPFFIWISSSLL